MEQTFSIRRSFWSGFNPFSWTRRTIIFTLVAFYVLFGLAFVVIGLHPAEAISAYTLDIPSLSLSEPIVDVSLDGSKLHTPDKAIGRYIRNPSSVFLFAHSVSAFSRLKEISLGTEIFYENEVFVVESIEEKPVESVNMNSLLAYSKKPRLVLMTCSGEETEAGFADRLIVTAKKK